MISGFRLPSHWKSNASAKKVTGSNTKKDSETSDCRPWWRTPSFALCRRRLPTYKSTGEPGRCESNCGAERTRFTWRSGTTGAGSIWRRRPPVANLVRRSVSPECESGPCCSAASWRSTPSQVGAPQWWRRCPYLRTRALLEAVQRYLDSIIKNPKTGELYTNAQAPVTLPKGTWRESGPGRDQLPLSLDASLLSEPS